MMSVKVTSKRQVTFPKRVLEMLGVEPGDRIAIEEQDDGFILRPKRIRLDRLGTLGHLIPDDHPPFDIAKFREEAYDPALRD